ncbi:magnesium-translocating P-type ATPase [Acuticoccus sp. M5D2P5]|uniref:magnesium-translocating P-type ATPase n=1 Tax=Acuticoccus kalidii TaxID=2910977 RepID=UPI001F167BC1|nr:magnesium-translocating P-type ATPase [Acuticoccus kalidii]MCF3933747.1 magnesium-translocating P-type ATPase [Acuticoccus kalidii]
MTPAPHDAAGTDAAWWALTAEDAMSRLGSGPDGLTATEAAARLARTGANALRPGSGTGLLGLALRQVANPVMLVLVGAALVSSALRQWIDAAIILTIVIGSALLGLVQEHRASRAVARLKARLALKASVMRDGRVAEIASSAIVPGDVVLLSAGSLVPADGLILEAADLFVIQSALTGEPEAARKYPGPVAATAGLAERTDAVFTGTSVRSGTGRFLAVATGEATEYAAIAGRLRLAAPETEFARGLRRYGDLLTRVMLVMVLVVFAANVFLERPPIDSLLFAIALAVGMSPELLPAVVSVTLASGARRMAARGVIVRRLDAIENLGSMEILCTDKTGTLTRGVMAVEAALDPDGAPSDRVLRLAILNASLQAGLANPLDDALVERGRTAGIDISGYEKVDEVPYDFTRRRLSVVVTDGTHETVMLTKGALREVLDVCATLRTADGCVPIDAARRGAIEALFADRSAAGLRVLGVASRPLPAAARVHRTDETMMTFEGFLTFLDPPKTGARETLAALAARGVATKVITGDNRLVARHIAEAVGLSVHRVVTGRDLAALREEALWRVAEDVDVFAEIDPAQKERIILALRRGGHVVGYLGDGINDAPALHAADVGISVDSAVDVAREAADFVLLQPDLAVLAEGIAEGRRTFGNTLKYISITTSANLGNMVSMALASLVLPFLPLLVKQILLNNFLSDFPGMAIASDRVDPEVLAAPHRWDMGKVTRVMLVFGLVSSAFDVLTFWLLLGPFEADAALFRTGWFVESTLTALLIVYVIRTWRPAWASQPGRLLSASTAAVAAFALAIPYLPGADLMGFVPLPWPLVMSLLAVTALYVAASEMAKWWFADMMR